MREFKKGEIIKGLFLDDKMIMVLKDDFKNEKIYGVLVSPIDFKLGYICNALVREQCEVIEI